MALQLAGEASAKAKNTQNQHLKCVWLFKLTFLTKEETPLLQL